MEQSFGLFIREVFPHLLPASPFQQDFNLLSQQVWNGDPVVRRAHCPGLRDFWCQASRVTKRGALSRHRAFPLFMWFSVNINRKQTQSLSREVGTLIHNETRPKGGDIYAPKLVFLFVCCEDGLPLPLPTAVLSGETLASCRSPPRSRQVGIPQVQLEVFVYSTPSQ